ncbi:hypothetical protein [Anaerotruncus sp. 1XD42-93]|nr:hypothetical protein [Anaerotruncus sp. 1XD42-93]
MKLEQLQEGTVFEAVDKLGNRFFYRFDRVDHIDSLDRTAEN